MDITLPRRKFLTTAATVGAASAVPFTLASAAPAAQAAETPAKTASDGAYVQPSAEGELVIASLDDLEARAAEVIPEGAFASLRCSPMTSV